MPSDTSILKNYALSTGATGLGATLGLFSLTSLGICLFATDDFIEHQNQLNNNGMPPPPATLQRIAMGIMGVMTGTASAASFLASWWLFKNAMLSAAASNSQVSLLFNKICRSRTFSKKALL